MANETKVGKRIKAYRENLKMSVADLAAKSGVAEAAIEAIENGETVAALGTLSKLARTLGQRLGTFTDDQFSPDPIVTRADDAGGDAALTHRDSTPDGSVYRSLAAGKPDRHMDPFHILLAADAPKTLSSHEGEELIICISGKVEITCGAETATLNPGDSAYYDSVVRHCVRAVGGPAAIYGVIWVPA